MGTVNIFKPRALWRKCFHWKSVFRIEPHKSREKFVSQSVRRKESVIIRVFFFKNIFLLLFFYLSYIFLKRILNTTSFHRIRNGQKSFFFFLVINSCWFLTNKPGMINISLTTCVQIVRVLLCKQHQKRFKPYAKGVFIVCLKQMDTKNVYYYVGA